MPSIRTDLAIEARELAGEQIPGIEHFEKPGEIPVDIVRVLDEKGKKAIDKEIGEYITIEVSKLKERDPAFEERAAQCFAEELRRLCGGLKPDDTVLVIGLGNSNMTPDSLGPKVVERVMVTRHIHEYIPEQIDERMRPVCAMTPGVLGVTGIETFEIIKGVVQRVKPAAVLVIDALAARKVTRIGSTVQLSDAGISPGSGVGNKRRALDRKRLSVPVIAIGVPMVSYAYTIAIDAISGIAEALHLEQTEKMEEEAGRVVAHSAGEMVVTPKEIDLLVEDAAQVVANGINLALHRDISLEEVARFMH